MLADHHLDQFGSYPLQPLSNWRGPNPCRCNGSSSKSSTKLLAMYTWICQQNPRFSEVVWVVSVALSQAAETYRVVSQTRRFTMVATYDQRMGRQVPCTTSSLFIGKQFTQYFQSHIRWFSIFSDENLHYITGKFPLPCLIAGGHSSEKYVPSANDWATLTSGYSKERGNGGWGLDWQNKNIHGRSWIPSGNIAMV